MESYTGEGSPASASFTIDIDVADQQIKLELETAFTNRENLLEFVHNNYRANRLNTPELDLQATIPPPILHEWSCLLDRQESILKTLQSLDSISDEDLNRVEKWEKVSAVFFLFVVAATNNQNLAGAAAPVSTLLYALWKWRFSVLMKQLKKRKEIIGFMILGFEMGIEYLSDIHDLALRLNLESESEPEATVDGERTKSAAGMKSFEELRLKVKDYNMELKLARERVLQRVITLFDY